MKKSLIWFRNDLRVADNHSLTDAVKDADIVIAAYCFDPRSFEQTRFGFPKTGKFRAQFLIESVSELRSNLRKLNIALYVFTDRPENVLPELTKEHGITDLYLQKEWTSEEMKVDKALKSALADNISWHTEYDQFLFHPEDIPYEDMDKIPEVFTAFRKKCEKYSKVRDLAESPKPIAKENYHAADNEIPDLEQLGLESFEQDHRSAFPFRGGEQAALDRLNQYFWESQNLSQYKKTRNGLVGTEYSSKFSAWLANGSISPRTIYHQVKNYEKEIKKNSSTYWMIFELIWRDYFKYISMKHGNAIFKIGGILNKDYDWRTDQHKLDNWIDGNTRYDFVNANMKELAATGWMSNRGRQNVASYWAKEIEQDWRIGASYFESVLIDYDVHSNWGNWMYNSGVGNDPRDRKFNIESQAERYDPNREFRKLWNE